jgi:osmotically-inducible protein OsmY
MKKTLISVSSLGLLVLATSCSSSSSKHASTGFYDTTMPAPTGRATASSGEIYNFFVDDSSKDRALAQQVLSGLRTDTTLTPAPAVNVHVSDGKVILSGTVPNEERHQAIVGAAQRAAGTKKVVDELRVQ